MNHIPKKIHYCWFGRSELPELAIRCINSWKKYFPDYEIVEWNEDNYDVNKILYTSEAYNAKKYAFVSDYARFDILYHEGGIYFDTDVEVIKKFDKILDNGAFMGCEKDYSPDRKKIMVAPGLGLAVNPGLGLAVNPGLGLYKDILDYYNTLKFINSDGSFNLHTIVEYTTQILIQKGLKNKSGLQYVAGITIYPKEYFCPKDIETKELTITENTYSIHHYDSSWAETYDKAAGIRGPKLKKIFGKYIGTKLNLFIYLIQKYRIMGIIRKIKEKI